MSTLAHPPRTMVCHELEAAERMPSLLRSFDALARGESFELRSTHLQKAAFERLQADRPGQFEWSPLQAGPDVWRTSVTRRTRPGTPRTVSETLERDHDRLDNLEREAFAARAACDLALATRLFHDFAHGLRRHIGFEERLVFPAFESRAGAMWDAGPTFVMRQEHREIEKLLLDMERGFADPAESLTAARAAFHEIMKEHNAKEERVLYPATDRLLTEREREELVGQIQAFTA